MRISKEELLKHVRGCLRNPIILVFDENVMKKEGCLL
jgi:hypothetical protein